MEAVEMMRKYVNEASAFLAENGRLGEYGIGLIEMAARFAPIVQAEAAERQAAALEKLAGCVSADGNLLDVICHPER